MGKELYRWKNVQGFCRVNLPVEADISLLGSYWQRLQTDQRDGRREKEHVGIKYGQQNPDTNMWDNQFCSKEKYDLYSAGFLVAEESTDR